MKKFTAILLALILTFSLSVTAFAADEGEAVSSSTNNFEDNQASSDVKVIYSNSSSQLSVTVPISITFAVQNDNSFVYPTTNSYKIINSSVVPVYVSEIKVIQGGAGAPYLVTDTPDAEGEVSLTMTAGSDSIALQADQGASTDHQVTQTIGSGNQWNITAGGELPINFSNGAVYTVDPSWIGSATKLFSITYTITAGSYITK